MTAKQTLDKLHRYLTHKEESAWAYVTYCSEIYGEDSDEAKRARSDWSQLFSIKDLIEQPDKLDELLAIWEVPND